MRPALEGFGPPCVAAPTSIDATAEAAAVAATRAAPHATKPPKMSSDIASARPSARMRAFCSGSTLSPLIAPRTIFCVYQPPRITTRSGSPAPPKRRPDGTRLPRRTNAPSTARTTGNVRSRSKRSHMKGPPFRKMCHAPEVEWPATARSDGETTTAASASIPTTSVSGRSPARGNGRPAGAPGSR
jgi:hypothetical protein